MLILIKFSNRSGDGELENFDKSSLVGKYLKNFMEKIAN
jgi:hypothetical protein